jgi:hypothetical protein
MALAGIFAAISKRPATKTANARFSSQIPNDQRPADLAL